MGLTVDLDQQHSVENAVHDNIMLRWLAVNLKTAKSASSCPVADQVTE